MRKLFFLFLALIIVAIFWLYSSYSSAVGYSLNPLSSDRVTVIIPKGSTGTQIGVLLKEKSLIKTESAFSFYLKQKGLSNKLQAGRYVVQENNTLPEIVDILLFGKASESAITLLEGWTAKQIAEYLEEEGITTVDTFMDCLKSCEFDFNFIPEDYLEGYLYPDTYFVALESYSDERFISRLINTLKNKLSDEDWTAINASEKDFEDIMIVASIIEREERADKEKATVAGILWNRYDAGTGLGADATVLYALGRTRGELTYQDLQVDSPYNTRKFAGLPPTPISNPGIESIRAALYAEDTDYWYYLHDSDGQIYYAKTLNEHNANKAKYLR